MSVNKWHNVSIKLTLVWISCVLTINCANGLLRNCTVKHRPNLLCDVTMTSGPCPKLERVPTKWPPPPMEFTLGTFVDEYTHFNKKTNKSRVYISPGLKMTWKTPQNSGAKDIEGFEVSIITAGGRTTNKQICIRMNLTGQIDDLLTQFEYSLFPINSQISVTALAYSLPKPDPKFDRSNNAVQQVKTPGILFADHPVSDKWVFGLNVNNNTCMNEVTCSFTLPPRAFNFSKVAVKLVRLGESNSYAMKTVTLPSHHAVFEGVPSGVFYLMIEVVDELRFDRGKCLCKDHDGTCSSCITTKSDNFNMGGNHTDCLNSTAAPIGTSKKSPTPSVGIINSTDAPIGTSEKSSSSSGFVDSTLTSPTKMIDDDRTWKAIMGPVGVLLGCLLIGLLCLVLKKKHMELKCCGKNQAYISSDKTKPPPESINNNQVVEASPVLRERVVYLAYTDDNSYHQRAVKLLAKYLAKQCKCSVLYPAWCLQDIQAKGPINWVLESIQKADYVLIINSEGAFKLNQARKENNPEFKLNDSPMGDIFTPAIKNIIYNVYKENAFKKYIMTQFQYSEEKFQIPEISAGYKYTLMKHFRELLCHIHQLSPEKPGENSQLLPLHLEDHDRTEEGKELLQAIDMAAIFTKNHPQWFEAMYGSDEDKLDSGVSSLPLDSLPDHLRERIQRECIENLHRRRPKENDIGLPSDLQLTFMPPTNDNDNFSITQSQVTFDPPCDLYSVFTDIGPYNMPYIMDNELAGHPTHGLPQANNPHPYLQHQMSTGCTDSGRNSMRSTESHQQNISSDLHNFSPNGNYPVPAIGCDSISMMISPPNEECNTSQWEQELARDCQIPVLILDNVSVDAMSV